MNINHGGNKFIDSLAADIRIAFPESKGYSVRNLKYMAKFAEIYPDREFVQQVVAQIPWGHNIVLLDKVTNFEHRLPSPQSELAVQTMKAPYVFDFIRFREDMIERDIKQAQERLSLIVEQMKDAEGVTEDLKAGDQMAWVRAMNSICNRAEEIVLKEIVYR